MFLNRRQSYAGLLICCYVARQGDKQSNWVTRPKMANKAKNGRQGMSYTLPLALSSTATRSRASHFKSVLVIGSDQEVLEVLFCTLTYGSNLHFQILDPPLRLIMVLTFESCRKSLQTVAHNYVYKLIIMF